MQVKETLTPLLQPNVEGTGESYQFSKNDLNPTGYLTDVKTNFSKNTCKSSYTLIVPENQLNLTDGGLSVTIVNGDEPNDIGMPAVWENYKILPKNADRSELQGYSTPTPVGDGSTLPFTLPEKLLTTIPDFSEWVYMKGTINYMELPVWTLGGDSIQIADFVNNKNDYFFCNLRFLPYYTDIEKTETNANGKQITTLTFNRENYKKFNAWYSVKAMKEAGGTEEDITGMQLAFDDRTDLPKFFGKEPGDLFISPNEISKNDKDLGYSNIRYVIEETGTNEWTYTYYNTLGKKTYEYTWTVE